MCWVCAFIESWRFLLQVTYVWASAWIRSVTHANTFRDPTYYYYKGQDESNTAINHYYV